MLTLQGLDDHIAECRALVEQGEESSETLEHLIALRTDLANASEADWAAYNELADHLPPNDADSTLVILKGHLLLERLVRRFIRSRFPNSSAFKDKAFSAHQCIQIAEAMCLSAEEPEWLWKQVKELNSIRNDLAHKLDYEHTDKRISSFISTVSNRCDLQNRTLHMCHRPTIRNAKRSLRPVN